MIINKNWGLGVKLTLVGAPFLLLAVIATVVTLWVSCGASTLRTGAMAAPSTCALPRTERATTTPTTMTPPILLCAAPAEAACCPPEQPPGQPPPRRGAPSFGAVKEAHYL